MLSENSIIPIPGNPSELQDSSTAKIPFKEEETNGLKLLSEKREPRLWTLYYRYGNIPQMTKSFEWDGDLQSAIIRARKHCDIINVKFICVRPLLIDLDFQEKAFLAGKYRESNLD